LFAVGCAASLGASQPQGLEVSVSTAERLTLSFEIGNATSHPIQISNLDVPWYGHTQSISMIVHEVDMNSGLISEFERTVPISTLDVGNVLIEPGQSIHGQVELAEWFPEATFSSNEAKRHFVFWSFAFVPQSWNQAIVCFGTAVLGSGNIERVSNEC
jgi:hypothetical protein